MGSGFYRVTVLLIFGAWWNLFVFAGPPREVSEILCIPEQTEAVAGARLCEEASQSFDTGFPATFEGSLPCADCEAIDYHLDLYEKRFFTLRMTYRGREPGVFDDIGSWDYSSDKKILLLQGVPESPLRFSIEGADELRLMGLDGESINSCLNYSLARTESFSPVEPRLRMSGMYRYMADAAVFCECLTGRCMPVLMEADNRELEKAYLKENEEPGEPIFVSLEGQLVHRMPMEGPGPVPALLPERFISISPGENCGPRFKSEELINTHWELARLGKRSIAELGPVSEPYIVFSEENRISGSDGCNRLMGNYRIDENRLLISQLASTMMACPQGIMDVAQEFRSVLEKEMIFRISGDHLELFDDSGELAARLEAAEADLDQ